MSRVATHPRMTKQVRKSASKVRISVFSEQRSDHRRRQSSTIVRITPLCCWYRRRALWLERMACEYLLDTDSYDDNCAACRHVFAHDFFRSLPMCTPRAQSPNTRPPSITRVNLESLLASRNFCAGQTAHSTTILTHHTNIP